MEGGDAVNEPGLLRVLRSNLERPRHARLAGLDFGDLSARRLHHAERTSTPFLIGDACSHASTKERISATVQSLPTASKTR